MSAKQNEIAAAELKRRLSDPEWRIANLYKIIVKGSDGETGLVQQFKPNRAQRRFISRLHHRNIILKARQLGFTTFTQAELFGDCHLYPLRQALVVSHRAPLTETIFQMSRRFLKNLPPALRPKLQNETKTLLHFDNDSRYQVETEGDVRGFTAQLVHLSEFAHFKDPAATWNALTEAVPDVPESLVIVESTANGVGNAYHDLWAKAVRGENSYVPLFFPWFEDPGARRKPGIERSDLSEEDRERMDRFGLDPEQMRWYVNTREDKHLGDQDKMSEENPSDPIEAFLASGRKVFDRHGLAYYRSRIEVRETLPIICEIEMGQGGVPEIVPERHGRLRIYRPPQARMRYTQGVDTSEGDGPSRVQREQDAGHSSDPTPGVILNQHTLDVDAVWYGRLPPEALAVPMLALHRYYNNALLIPEANKDGAMFINTIMGMGLENIYYRRTSVDSIAGRETDKAGFDTKGHNRPHIINCAREYVRKRAGRIDDADLVGELETLIYTDADRAEAPSGYYDDLVMAFGLAIFAHKEAPEIALLPLPPEQVELALAGFAEVLALASMGKSTSHIDLQGLSVEELLRLQEAVRRREETRARIGYGGQV